MFAPILPSPMRPSRTGCSVPGDRGTMPYHRYARVAPLYLHCCRQQVGDEENGQTTCYGTGQVGVGVCVTVPLCGIVRSEDDSIDIVRKADEIVRKRDDHSGEFDRSLQHHPGKSRRVLLWRCQFGTGCGLPSRTRYGSGGSKAKRLVRSGARWGRRSKGSTTLSRNEAGWRRRRDGHERARCDSVNEKRSPEASRQASPCGISLASWDERPRVLAARSPATRVNAGTELS